MKLHAIDKLIISEVFANETEQFSRSRRSRNCAKSAEFNIESFWLGIECLSSSLLSVDVDRLKNT